ncbi:slit homolog 1 protein-like isoform X1 [Saccostrea cucullata]|uniref:slit homolog 1 protein-like isoform X1 n=1 Tax=Saccostrea cuccullata TaxID=36930 RepID=UPI002ED0C4EA
MILFSAILSCYLYTCVTDACPAECTCTGTNVDCSSKGLTSVPTGIPAETRNITLASNQISRIENDSFKGLTALQYLFLENNQLSRIADKTFILLPNLKTLFLSSNQITRIEKETFAGLSNVQSLYLDSNRITAIDEESFTSNGMFYIQYLNLNNNDLTNIDNKTFVGLRSNLKSLSIEGNPFHCDCVLAGFVEFMSGFVSQSIAKCITPENLGGRYVKDLTSSMVCPNPSTGSTSQTTGATKDVTTKQKQTSLSSSRTTNKAFAFTSNPQTENTLETTQGTRDVTTKHKQTSLSSLWTTDKELTFTSTQSSKSRISTFFVSSSTETGTPGFTAATTREPKTGRDCSFNEDLFLVSLMGNGVLFSLVVILVCVLGKLLRNKRNQASRYVNFERDCAGSGHGEYTQPKVVRVGGDGYLEPYNHSSDSGNHSSNTRNHVIHSEETAFVRKTILSNNSYAEIVD